MIKIGSSVARRRPRFVLLTAALAASALAVAACSSDSGDDSPSTAAAASSASPAAGASSASPAASAASAPTAASYGFDAAKQDASSTITIWVDATRQPAVDAFKKAHPEIPIKIETYDGGANGSGSFQTKVEAFNQAGSGWPDVVFSTQNNDASWASREKAPFAAPLNKGYFDQAFLDGFTPGALAPVTVGDTVYGLRNDLAPTVTWYDKALMDKFGYQVPKTWEEFQALGQKVGTEHPGYIVGSVGDPWTPEVFFWGAKAPVNTVTGSDGFSANTSDAKSVAMAKVLDSLLKSGSLAQDSVFSPEFVKKYAGKVLMLPGPVWYSGAIFQNKDSLNATAGTIGAGPPLGWGGEDAVAGNVGGGTWFISRHSKNLASAKAFLEFVTSADDYQVALAPGLPAYAAAGAKWLAKQAESKFFTSDFTQNVTTAAGSVWDQWGYPSFSQEAVWAKTVTPPLAAGKTLESLLPSWQKALQNEAQANGYKVS